MEWIKEIVNYNSVAELLIALENEEKKGIHLINDNDDKFFCYAELFKKAKRRLGGLQGKGIKSREKIIFQIHDLEEFIVSFWACMLGGIIPVPIPIGLNEEGINRVLNVMINLGEAKVLTTAGIKAKVFDVCIAKNPLIDEKDIITCESIVDNDDKVELYEGNAQETAFIQYSSGSTGDAKGIVLTHENLLYNIVGIVLGASVTANESTISWLPLTHDMGIIGFLLAPTAAQIEQYHMLPTLFAKNPKKWLDKASEYKITMLSSPNFGYKYLLDTLKMDGTQPDWDLSNVRIIFNGAEPISAELCMEFLRVLSKFKLNSNCIFTVYGMAEATLAVCFPIASEPLRMMAIERNSMKIGQPITVMEVDDSTVQGKSIFVDEGYPVEGCEVRICVDECEVADNILGHIEIRGKNVTRGYYNSDKNQSLFTKDGWLKTGDLGFKRNGRITVTGRYKDIIFVNGLNIYPYDIEKIIQNKFNISNEKIAIGSYSADNNKQEKIILFMVMPNINEVQQSLLVQIKRAIAQEVGVEISMIVPVEELSKTGSGKIQRFKMVERFLAGEFNENIERLQQVMSSIAVGDNEEEINEVEKILKEVFSRYFNGVNIGINDNFFDHGGNSIVLTKIYNELNEIFPNKIVITDLFSAPTIRKLSEVILGEKQLELQSIPFPTEYFEVSKGAVAQSSFTYTVDEDKFKALVEFCSTNDIRLDVIYLSIYAYVLSQISTKDTINIQTAISDAGILVSNTIEIDNKLKFIELCKRVQENIAKSTIRYTENQIDTISLKHKHQKALMPLIYEDSKINNKEQLLKVFDFIVNIKVNTLSTQIYFEYDSMHINNHQASKLINLYINLLLHILKNEI